MRMVYHEAMAIEDLTVIYADADGVDFQPLRGVSAHYNTVFFAATRITTFAGSIQVSSGCN